MFKIRLKKHWSKSQDYMYQKVVHIVFGNKQDKYWKIANALERFKIAMLGGYHKSYVEKWSNNINRKLAIKEALEINLIDRLKNCKIL